MGKYVTRMGDGFKVELTESEINRDIEEGSQEAAKNGQIAPLNQDESLYLLEIFKCFQIITLIHMDMSYGIVNLRYP